MSSNTSRMYSSDSHGNNPMSYKTSVVNCSSKKVDSTSSATYPSYTPTSNGYDIESGGTISTHCSTNITFAQFAAQTLNYVSIQLMCTMFICGLVYNNKEHMLNRISQNSGYVWFPIIFTFIALIGLHFSENNSWSQSLWFWFFTISCSFIVTKHTS